MRAVIVAEPGTAEALKIVELGKPVLASGEVLVEVVASGVNRADILQRRGFYPPPKGESEIIGLEVSGRIAEVASDVTEWQIGDECVALLAGGGYADYVAVPAGQCIALPPGVDLASAAGYLEVAATVVSNLDHVGLKSGEKILVHGGAGGIGSLAIPYAKVLGATVLTTAGNLEKLELCRERGADFAFNYHEDWTAQLKEAVGGVDVILDIIGAKYLADNVSVLGRGGRLVVIGLQGGVKAEINLNQILSKGATLTATSLRFRPKAEKAQICAAVAKRIWPLFAAGKIPKLPVKEFDFSQVVEAHKYLESGANVGKIVLLH